MRTQLFAALAVVLLAAGCNRHPAQTEKDMTQLSFTPEQAAWMTAIAANEIGRAHV